MFQDQQQKEKSPLDLALDNYLKADTELDVYEAMRKFVALARAEIGRGPMDIAGSYSFRKKYVEHEFNTCLVLLRSRKKINLLEVEQ